MHIRYENKGCLFWDLFPHPLILLKGYSKYAETDLLKQKQLAPINAEIVMKVAILYKRMQDDSRITVFAVVGHY